MNKTIPDISKNSADVNVMVRISAGKLGVEANRKHPKIATKTGRISFFMIIFPLPDFTSSSLCTADETAPNPHTGTMYDSLNLPVVIYCPQVGHRPRANASGGKPGKFQINTVI